MTKIKSINTIWILLGAALFLRLLLSFFGTLQLDLNTFIGWSNRLLEGGFANFYESWSDYLPGYLYVLWLLAKLKTISLLIPTTLLYKLPAILADIAAGFLIYKIVKKYKNERLALISSSLYIFNPAVWANSALWGQVDSLTALFSLLAVYLAGTNYLLSAVVLALGAVIKPQASLAALVVGFIMIRDKWNYKKILVYMVMGAVVFAVTFIPFTNFGDLPSFIYERMITTLNQYPYTSVNAFNFWGFFGFWSSDTGSLFSPGVLGVIIVIVSFFITVKAAKKARGVEYLLLTVLFTANFLFFSRMHERHLLPALAPMAIVAGLSLDLWIPYFGFSLTYILNLYYSYIWITKDFKTVFSDFTVKLFVVLNLGLFVFLIVKGIKNLEGDRIVKKLHKYTKLSIQKGRLYLPKKRALKSTEVKLPKSLSLALLSLIIIFSFATRLIYISKPQEEYFDEVYHAFTAKVMLHGDPRAWEWWNPHPEGFAYEWTHPPIAKEGMWLSMIVFGERAVGWRFPGVILGTGSVLLIYLITKKLFKDEALSLIASFLFALDGLPLVMSRIGMNDSYLLFFILLTVYLSLVNKYFLSAVALGLALSSKWSAVWVIPIIVLIHFTFKRKLKLNYLWYFVIPLLVYLASYIPMFMVGDHSFQTFIDVQKQMWWYHTGLDATHPFTSQWYTWPFLIRPIWLYTSGVVDGMVSNIYAMGNPIIFWGGIVSVIVGFYYALVERNKKLALVVFSYFIFFIPWAVSPRIMFLYHYLPSVSFIVMILAYVLKRNMKILIPFLIISVISFMYFYPHWIGYPVNETFDKTYYWLDTWG